MRSQTGDEMRVLVKPTVKICKLIDAYCNRHSVSKSDLKFVFDGQRISANDTNTTVGDLELEDGDVIDVMIEQIGGR